MPRRLVRRDVLWLSTIVGLFVLLAVQVPFGARGFGQQSVSPFLRLLESPGRLLGWGGVALLVVGLAYALVTWMRGVTPGRVLAILGTLVFAVGIGAFAGALAATPERGGGVVAGGLARMLVDVIGSFPAALVLAVIAVPGLLLALAPLLLDTSNRPTRGESASSDAIAKPWYPERRIGPDGLEIPMQLGGTDVGPIRFREPGDDPQAAPPAAPKVPVDASLPKSDEHERRSKRITGVRFQDEGPEAAAPPPAEPAPEIRSKRITGVRFQDEGPEAAAPPPEAPKETRLAPGVRYVEAPPAPEPPAVEAPPPVVAEPAAPTAAPSPTARKSKGKRGDAAAPTANAAVAATVETAVPPAPVSAAVPASANDAAAPTYRGKLAATGIFEAGTPVTARGGKPPTPKPRPATSRSIDDALKSLFSSLPLDELPPPRTPEPEEPVVPEVVLSRDDPNQTSLFGRGATGIEVRPRGAAHAPAPAAARAPAPVRKEPAARPESKRTPAKTEPNETKSPPPAKAEAKPAPEKSAAPRGKAKVQAKHPATADALFPAAVEAAIERGSASLVLLKRKLNVGYERAESLMNALVAEGVVGEMTASGSRPTLISAQGRKGPRTV